MYFWGGTVQFSRLDSQLSFGAEIRSKLCCPASSFLSCPPDLDPPSISQFGLIWRSTLYIPVKLERRPTSCSDRDLIFWRRSCYCWTSSFVPFLSISTIRIGGRFRSIWQIKPSSTSSSYFMDQMKRQNLKSGSLSSIYEIKLLYELELTGIPFSEKD